ncbi:acyltransferase [Macrococcus brunensis]|nr:acyltransferase [Macrococcus brunensis]
MKRFFRIAPTFYAAFLFYLIFNMLKYALGMTHALGTYSLSAIFGTLSFMNIIRMDWLFSLVPGGWSISNEVLFYLLLPILFYMIRDVRSGIIVTLLIVVLGIGVTILSLQYYDYDPRLYMYYFYWFPNQLPVFCMGILLYFIVEWSEQHLKWRRSALKVLMVMTISIVMVLSTFRFTGYWLYFNHYLYGLLFSFFAFQLSQYQSRLLVNKFLVFLGKISFSVYLIHFFFIEIAMTVLRYLHVYRADSMLQYLGVLLTVSVLSIMTAAWSYRYIELPGIRFGRKLSSKC